MEMEAGKLFVGGISWETSEERLKEYFGAFGEVIEAVIMRDRTTGRARGFGFIVFSDASVAEKVVRERHVIDGRTVEAKKAVPRDDHQTFIKTNGILHASPGPAHGSPGPARTKKIFVGGLASTVTETDFKKYFDQFGTVTDVVVMYDHNTLRPRGFGFVTFDSEEAVDKVLVRNFHELNGKMVEVKRAVPKELSPGPARNPSSCGYSYGPNRATGFFNSCSPGNNNSNINLTGGYGMRMDGRFSPVTVGRSGYQACGPGNHTVGLDLDSGLGLNYGIGMEYSYFGGKTIGNGSLLSTTNRNSWGDLRNPNYITKPETSNGFLGFGTGDGGLLGGLGSIGEVLGGSARPAKATENTVYGGVQDNYGDIAGYMRDNRGTGGGSTSLSLVMDNAREGDNSFYSDHGWTWHSSSRELEGSGPFSYGRGDRAADVGSSNSVGCVGDYSVARSNRGIAA
ncbi:hypothetical protein OROHE_010465 [Orobanche hederae]